MGRGYRVTHRDCCYGVRNCKRECVGALNSCWLKGGGNLVKDEGQLAGGGDGASTACRMRLEGFLAKDLDRPMKLCCVEGEEKESIKREKEIERGRVEEKTKIDVNRENVEERRR